MGGIEENCKKIIKISAIVIFTLAVFIIFPFLFGYSYDTVQPVKRILNLVRIWS